MYKKNIPMIMAFVLLGATLVTTHFVSGLYARYTVSDNASDSAKVAKFQIETDLDYVSLGLADNETPNFELGGDNEISQVQIPFYIESRSEVTATYSVRVDFGIALPNYVTLTLSDGTNSESISADGVKTSYDFVELGTMEAFTGTDSDQAVRAELTLTISVSDMGLISEEINLSTAVLTIKVDQVD